MRFLFDLWTRWKLRKRLLFRFHDGSRWRYADPLRVVRAYDVHPKLNVAEMAPLVDAAKEPETTIFVEATCEIFGVQRWDGRRGLADHELLNLYEQFGAYIVALKKNTSPPPTSSPTSADPGASQPPAIEPDTSWSADSLSTPVASGIGQATGG